MPLLFKDFELVGAPAFGVGGVVAPGYFIINLLDLCLYIGLAGVYFLLLFLQVGSDLDILFVFLAAFLDVDVFYLDIVHFWLIV